MAVADFAASMLSDPRDFAFVVDLEHRVVDSEPVPPQFLRARRGFRSTRTAWPRGPAGIVRRPSIMASAIADDVEALDVVLYDGRQLMLKWRSDDDELGSIVAEWSSGRASSSRVPAG